MIQAIFGHDQEQSGGLTIDLAVFAGQYAFGDYFSASHLFYLSAEFSHGMEGE